MLSTGIAMLHYLRSLLGVQRSVDLVVAAGLGITALSAFGAAYWKKSANENVIVNRFDETTQHVAQQFQSQFQRYEYGLRGARGAIVAAGDELSRERFSKYSKTRNLEAEFPGSRGFGFIRIVPPALVETFLAQARKDNKPSFEIRELGEQAGDRYVIQYIEPEETNLPAIGLDISSERRRRDAALAAVERDQAILSAPITLVQASGLSARSFLFLLPVYRPGQPLDTPDQRRAAAIGWSYTPLIIDDVLASAHFLSDEFDLSVYDKRSGDSLPFYSTTGAGEVFPDALSKRLEVSLYGRDLDLFVRARPQFIEQMHLGNPALYGSAVLLIGLLLTNVLFQHLSKLRAKEFNWREGARLASIVAESSEAMIGTTLTGEVTDWNPAAEHLFGYSASEAMGRKLSDLIVPRDLWNEREVALKRVFESRSCVGLVTKRKSRDGKLLDMVVNLSPICSESGEIVGIGTSARDMTSYVEAQKALQKLNASLERQVVERTAELETSTVLQRAILEHSGYAVIATTPEGIVSLFNPAAEAMLGYRSAEVIGRMSAAAFHDPAELKARAEELSQDLGRPVGADVAVVVAMSKYRRVDATWTYLTKSGDRIPVRLSVSKLKSADGKNLGVLAIAIDQTEQIKYEAELNAAREKAEQAANTKSEFLASMSHELRTPLNSIIGFSRLIMESRELKSSQIERQSELIHHASTTLLSIVNDILDVSKLEADRFELDCRSFPVRPLFEKTVALMNDQADAKGLSLVLAISPSVPENLVGDDARIRQVVLNLLANAVKFTGKGGVTVAVVLTGVRAGMAKLRVSVRDTGIGISDAARSCLFQRFSQVDSGIARSHGGTGLGLSICKRLIELMGGDIDFNSKEGEGSEFWFAIDLPVADAASFAAGEDELGIEPGIDRQLTILLAEDNPLNQELALSVIGAWGHHVDIVSDGVQAIEAVRDKQYDLVLMDVQMPVMDGVEATTRIRSFGDRYASLPIIAMTAAVLQNQVDQFRKAGMSDHIGKPFDAQRLRRMINFWGAEQVEQTGIELAPTSCQIEAEAAAEPRSDDSGPQDKGRYNALAEMIGADRAEQLTRKFADDLSTRFQDMNNLTVLRVDAHTITSSAGLLGFSRLSERARKLEHACDSRVELEDCKQALLNERAEVERHLRQLAC